MNTESTLVVAPLLSVNEPEAQVVEILVKPGQSVRQGELLCVLATTKASFDVEAEVSGYVHRVMIAPNKNVSAGEPMFEIGPERPLEVEKLMAVEARSTPTIEPPEDLRITQKALKLARELKIDLNVLPRDSLVTESVVRTFRLERPPVEEPPVKPDLPLPVPEVHPCFDASTLLIYGAGGHAKKIIDLVRQNCCFRLAGVIADPAPTDPDLLGVPILGGSDILPSLWDNGWRLIVNGVGGIHRPLLRVEIFSRLALQRYTFPILIHQAARVSSTATLEAGVQIFDGALIGPSVKIGFGVIINTGTVVSHDCTVGDYAHLTPGVILAGRVKVGRGALIGMGVTTDIDVTIGEWARIGNGCRINADVPPRATIPSGTTWSR